MSSALSNDQFWAHLAAFTRSAFRLELQPRYVVDYERDLYNAYLAGTARPATDSAALRAWLDRVRHQVSEGKVIERVRVVDEPPTDYQRWMKYMDRWNREAGETILYLTRAHARHVGLLPDAGPGDWWLLDDERLITMDYDAEGRRVRSGLTTGGARLRQARAWRALAVSAARGVHR